MEESLIIRLERTYGVVCLRRCMYLYVHRCIAHILYAAVGCCRIEITSASSSCLSPRPQYLRISLHTFPPPPPPLFFLFICLPLNIPRTNVYTSFLFLLLLRFHISSFIPPHFVSGAAQHKHDNMCLVKVVQERRRDREKEIEATERCWRA